MTGVFQIAKYSNESKLNMFIEYPMIKHHQCKVEV